MKLVSGKMAHADTICTDDGIILGVVYYTVKPIDDEGRKASDILHEWWAGVTATERLRHHVTGAIERGEAEAIVEKKKED